MTGRRFDKQQARGAGLIKGPIVWLKSCDQETGKQTDGDDEAGFSRDPFSPTLLLLLQMVAM